MLNRWPGPAIQATNSGNNTIAGNFLGTDPTGTIARVNANPGVAIGVYIVGASISNNVVGGTTPADRNLISGNPLGGVQTLSGTAHKIQGNFIGTDVTGKLPLGNADGVTINSASNVVGGTAAGAGNVISANTSTGVLVQGNGASSFVQGNFIGTDVTGTKPLGNAAGGVLINSTTPDVTIGGPTLDARNLISANGGWGVSVLVTSGTVIQGNLIGTDVTGTVPLGNAFFGAQFGGVFLNGSTNTVVGGPDPGEGNLIAFNAGDGVTVFGFGTETGNRFGATPSSAKFTSRFRSIRSWRSTSATTAPRPTTPATGTRGSTNSRTTRSSPPQRRSLPPPARTSWACSTARRRPPTRSTSTRTLLVCPTPTTTTRARPTSARPTS